MAAVSAVCQPRCHAVFLHCGTVTCTNSLANKMMMTMMMMMVLMMKISAVTRTAFNGVVYQKLTE